jgi:Mg-chelatase subunit ChlD
MVIVSLLIVSASGPQLHGRRQGVAVVFVVDHSQSISQADRATALTYIQRTAAAMQVGDRAGVVVFGQEALIEQALRESFTLATV